jgi:predicted nuclease of restriction endonuclease-like RecB superfamily
MLTKDLARFKVRDGIVLPGWLRVDRAHNINRAGQLIDVMDRLVGGTRGELEEALRTETDTSRDFRVRRGLAHLLLNRATFDMATTLPPTDVRQFVFERAAQAHPISNESRAVVLAAAAAHFGVAIDDIEHALYADLDQHQRYTSYQSMSSEELLHRYNVALAQAILLRCSDVHIALRDPTPKRLRQLFRYLKFYRLLYRPEADPGGNDGLEKDYRIVVDGPLSIVNQSTRYGLSLAQFLPALLLCEDWSLTATVQAKKRSPRGLFQLDSALGLASHYPNTGMWIADEERALFDRLVALASPWRVEEGSEWVDLAGYDAFVPDWVIRDPETGRFVYVEIIWRWRRRSLEKRWKLLQEHGPANMVLAVCRNGRADLDALPVWQGRIHTFAQIPNARSILKLTRESMNAP